MRSRRSWPRYQVDPPGRRIIASKSPASGRGIALAVLHHDADQPTLAFFPAARSGAQYFQEFFGDDGAIGVNARSKAGHRLLVGVEVEDPRRAWFLAGAFPKSGELGRDQTAVEICPMTVPLGIRDGLIISPARTETSGECEGNNCQSGQSGGQYHRLPAIGEARRFRRFRADSDGFGSGRRDCAGSEAGRDGGP